LINLYGLTPGATAERAIAAGTVGFSLRGHLTPAGGAKRNEIDFMSWAFRHLAGPPSLNYTMLN